MCKTIVRGRGDEVCTVALVSRPGPREAEEGDCMSGGAKPSARPWVSSCSREDILSCKRASRALRS